MWSTKPIEIVAGESTQVSFRFDIPKVIYEKVYATAIGEDTGIIETCEFNDFLGLCWSAKQESNLRPFHPE